MIQVTVKSIINKLFQAKVSYENFEATAIADHPDQAIIKAVSWLKKEIDHYAETISGFEIVEDNSLKIFKMPIQTLGGLADHYYLSETEGLNHSIGWGPQGIELRGWVKITRQQHQRIQQFSQTAKYNIALNNCEHFANYVIYGLDISSQQSTWWKFLGSDIIQRLQPSQTVSQNLGQEISQVLNHNLILVKISKFQTEYENFLSQYPNL
ncbi:MAG: hypothetical protein ACKO1W_13885 [Microcystaceae cyanobacterium]